MLQLDARQHLDDPLWVGTVVRVDDNLEEGKAAAWPALPEKAFFLNVYERGDQPVRSQNRGMGMKVV